MKMEIEKDVPLPSRAGKGSKYPWPDMDVGDSIQVSADLYSRAVSSAGQYGRKAKKKFTGRSRELRIWRIK
jgi:hypothetical protein